MRVAAAAAVALATVVGCDAPPSSFVPGDRCPDPTVHLDERIPGPGALTGPSCVAGSFAGVDVEGVWDVDSPAGTVRGSFGVWTECDTLYSTGHGFAHHTDDRLYVAHVSYDAGDYFYGRAYLLCGVDPDGSLRGYGVSISVVPGFPPLDDTPYEIVARPLGWIDGESRGQGLELLSQWDGTPYQHRPSLHAMNVRVHDRTAYLVAREGLLIVDVRNPREPATLGWFEARNDDFNDVKVVERRGRVYALLGSNTVGTSIVDVTDPTAPREVRRFNPNSAQSSSTHTLFAQPVGDTVHAYFVDGASPVLSVYDLDDPTLPVAVSRYEDYQVFEAAGFHDLYVEGNRAYVNATTGGFAVFALDAPQPTLLGRTLAGETYSHSNWVTTAGGRRIAVHGGEGVGSFVRIIDVDESSPEFLDTIGEFRLRERVSVHNIMAIGETAYVAYYQNGVRVLDLSDPTAPQQVAYYNTWDPTNARGAFFEGAFGVDVDPARGLVYVADSEAGLVILRRP